MSKKLGYSYFDRNNPYGPQQFSEKTHQIIDKEIQKVVNECTEKTRKLINDHKNDLKKLSKALLKRE